MKKPNDNTIHKRASMAGIQGWQQFLQNKIDMLNHYNSSKAYNVGRKVKTKHGLSAEAEFRSWLSEFLPKKFGVTSGYIVSPFKESSDSVMEHYDVIIYDRINSPILWVEDLSDNSESGKARAIPAEYVYCVMEVKSNFRDAESAVNKIQSLKKIDDLFSENEYQKTFPANFCCGIIFFELKNPQKYKRDLFNKLDLDLRGYFGAIILSAEDQPIEMTGTIWPTVFNSGTESNYADIHDSSFSCGKTALRRMGNADLAMLIVWGEPFFSIFAFDLLARMNGTYRPGFVSSFHGLSWVDDSREKNK